MSRKNIEMTSVCAIAVVVRFHAEIEIYPCFPPLADSFLVISGGSESGSHSLGGSWPAKVEAHHRFLFGLISYILSNT